MTPKLERFCQEIVKGESQSDAYRVAFKANRMKAKTIHEEASRLMAKPKVTTRIAELRAPVVTAIRFNMERRLQELGHAAFLDPIDFFNEHGPLRKISDMPEHARRALAGYEVDRNTLVTKLKFIDKRGAIMDYSKLAGDMPLEKHEVKAVLTVEQLLELVYKRDDKRDPKVIHADVSPDMDTHLFTKGLRP